MEQLVPALFTKLPSICILSFNQCHQITDATAFPRDKQIFEQLFTVMPLVNKQGQGCVHVNFRIFATETASFFLRDDNFKTLFRDLHIRFCSHNFATTHLKTVGIITHKSTKLTHYTNLHSRLLSHLQTYLNHTRHTGNESSMMDTSPGTPSTVPPFEIHQRQITTNTHATNKNSLCLLYTSDAADE